jgi:hypothetical protein
MHILEQFRFLLDNGYIDSTNNGKWYVIKFLENEIEIPTSIEELIQLRVNYFIQNQQSAKSAVLLCLIAKIGSEIPIKLLKYFNLSIEERKYLEQLDIGYEDTKDGTFKFRHENYYRALYAYQFDVTLYADLVNQAAEWFKRKPKRVIKDKLSYVRLLELLKEDINIIIPEAKEGYLESQKEKKDEEQFQFINFIIENDESDLESYQLDKYQLMFEKAICFGRFGSWEDASKRLVEVADLCEAKRDKHYDLIQIEALADAANKIISLQRPDEALALIKRGLNIVSCYLETQQLTDEEKIIFLMLRKKLWLRTAVAKWFDGDVFDAIKYQKKAFELIEKFKDSDIEEWCAIHRELGATIQHYNPKEALKLFDKSLKIGEANKDKIHPLHLLLTRCEQLIAKLILETNNKKPNVEIIKAIGEEAQRVYTHSLMQNTLTEAVFSSLVVGAVFAYLEDHNTAFLWFRDATTLAIKCQRQDELWKARLNLAQIYSLLKEDEQAKIQAKLAYDLIVQGLNHNPESRFYRKKLLTLPLYHIRRLNALIDSDDILLYTDSYEVKKMNPWETRPIVYSKESESQQVLHVRKGNNDFFLLN